jgi:hypothetical protein
VTLLYGLKPRPRAFLQRNPGQHNWQLDLLLLFCTQIHGSAGWISWPARDWHEATTPPSLWNNPEWVCDQCDALIRAGSCPADEINAARVWVWRVAGLWCLGRVRSAVPPLGSWGQTQTGLDSGSTVC